MRFPFYVVASIELTLLSAQYLLGILSGSLEPGFETIIAGLLTVSVIFFVFGVVELVETLSDMRNALLDSLSGGTRIEMNFTDFAPGDSDVASDRVREDGP